VFITLRKHGRLRGCIGTFDAREDLIVTIRRMAVAATQDPRFANQLLSVAELPDLRIEISLLGPMTPINDPLQVEIGRHGVYIRRGLHTGCFLPEVAAEHGWDAATFLSVCCREKAELDPLAWQQPDTEVFVFTAEKCCEA
jgi:AmmeMemoRadiSam system protein A